MITPTTALRQSKIIMLNEFEKREATTTLDDVYNILANCTEPHDKIQDIT